jgi:hypothetical protein
MEHGGEFRCSLQSHHRQFNTAVGGHALYGNISQSTNTAVGAFALAANSSALFKEQIKPTGKSSESILALKPVAF